MTPQSAPTYALEFGGGGGGGGGEGSSPPSQTCESSGTLKCGGKSFPQFRCSPLVTSSIKASLTLNNFSQGGDGGSPSECDNKFHDNSERVVALSTGWYDNESRCGKMIRITASNGRSVTAKVVDECDSVNGCDSKHVGQPPCNNNIVDRLSSIWDALGLNQDLGVIGKVVNFVPYWLILPNIFVPEPSPVQKLL